MISRRRWAAGVLTISIALAASVTGYSESSDAELCVEACREASICYRAIAWQEGAEAVGEAAPAPVATMDVQEPLVLGGIDLEAGHYAWLLRHEQAGKPALELRPLTLPEGVRRLDPLEVGGNVGDALYRAPLRFDASEGVTPRLTFQLIPGSDGIRLSVQYGDGRFDSLLLRRGEP